MQKTLACLLCVILSLFPAALSANPLEGSWRLVSGQLIDDETITDYDEAQIKSIKVIAGNHFSFVSHKGDSFYASAAGRVVVDGDSYSEVPQYASYPPLIGKTFSFTFELDGDVWRKERYENGKLVEVEVWQRLP